MATKTITPPAHVESKSDPSASASNLQYQTQQYLNEDTVLGSTMTDSGGPFNPSSPLPNSQTEQFHHPQEVYPEVNPDFNSPQHAQAGQPLSRSSSRASLGRGNTLRRKNSVSKKDSLKKTGSRKSLRNRSGSGAARTPVDPERDVMSIFYTPIPTSGSPCEILANRFQGK
jgi:hypothetical protein